MGRSIGRSALERQTDAQERIAEELSRLRALKEFQLGVLTTTSEGMEDDGVHIIRGMEVPPHSFPLGSSRYKGAMIWHEDSGIIRKEQT